MSKVKANIQTSASRTVELEEAERFPMKKQYGRGRFQVDTITEYVSVNDRGIAYKATARGRALTAKGNLHAVNSGDAYWYRPSDIPEEVAAHLSGESALLDYAESGVLAFVESTRAES